MPNFTAMVYAQFQVEGFHYWENAPENVAYLRNRHRHMFHYKVVITVKDHDREIEFITLKNECLNSLSDMYLKNDDGSFEFGGKSCEMLAKDLIERLYNHLNYKVALCVSVSEDGENGAEVVYA